MDKTGWVTLKSGHSISSSAAKDGVDRSADRDIVQPCDWEVVTGTTVSCVAS